MTLPAHKNSNDKPRAFNVLSVCSGIGTDAVAWQPLGWKHLCFAEIEKFPSAVLAHHWPHVINRGDFTKIGDEYRGAADLLVGGTPCQSFSVAGLRGGLADDRGNLALEFLRLADRTRPRWVAWENVPGVLSSDGGRDFGSILGGLGQLGYGWAYRILDAQHFGVPQRRRRVFVVGHLGDWRRAAAVLFERHSLQGNHPPRREKGQGFTHELAPSLTASGRGVERSGDSRGQDPIVAGAVSSKWAKGTGGPAGDECYNLVAHSLRADGFDASEDGTGRGTPIIPILEAGARTGKSTDDPRAGIGIGEDGDPMYTLQSGKQHAIGFSAGQSSKAGSIAAREEQSPTLRGAASGTNQVPAIAIRTAQTSSNGCGINEDGQSYALDGAQGQAVAIAWDEELNAREDQSGAVIRGGEGGRHAGVMTQAMAVRRLTPRECERLQGLPDDFTLVPFNGKPAADGPRYKAIGNGMAMPVLRWIGERIALVESLVQP